jgi:hypothetical protein
MNICLFIDTNIYLRFYDSKQGAFKKLLRALEEVKGDVFYTSQILNEINRNKESLFLKSFDEYIKQTSIPNITLPDHIILEEDKAVSAWNKKREQISSEVKKSADELKEIKTRILSEIAGGKDEVFRVIQSMSIISFDSDIEANARFRKECGNPPGKREDPLGDQLNWECLLKYINEKGTDHLLIVSNDNDFFVESGASIKLNYLLQTEVFKSSTGNIDIYCFNTLAEALKKYSTLKNIKTLPSDKELKEIKEEEANDRSDYWNARVGVDLLGAGSTTSSGRQFVTTCPYCQKMVVMKPQAIYAVGHKMFQDFCCPECNASTRVNM